MAGERAAVVEVVAHDIVNHFVLDHDPVADVDGFGTACLWESSPLLVRRVLSPDPCHLGKFVFCVMSFSWFGGDRSFVGPFWNGFGSTCLWQGWTDVLERPGLVPCLRARIAPDSTDLSIFDKSGFEFFRSALFGRSKVCFCGLGHFGSLCYRPKAFIWLACWLFSI